MKKIEFSYNWNNKLNCKSFSTVRLENPKKYKLLDIYEVILKTKGNSPDISKGLVRLQAIHNFYLHEVSPAISFLDANLSTIDFQKLVITIYKNKNVNFHMLKMSFLVFQYLPIKESEKLQMKQLEFEK
jgi:hypothetical protein